MAEKYSNYCLKCGRTFWSRLSWLLHQPCSGHRRDRRRPAR